MSFYQVGCSKSDITPPIGMSYLGWRPRHQPITGIHDPLYASAAYIEAVGERVIIVSADTIGFANTLLGPGRSFIGEVKQEIEQRTGIPGSHVLIASNHIHSSAETLDFRPLSAEYPDAIPWLEGLQKSLVDCAVRASLDTHDAKLKVGKGGVSGVAKNRRGDDCLDQEVIALVFESDDMPALTLINYACHPVILQVWDQVSADYVGAMRRYVEDETGAPCIFLMGACGDINPLKADSKDYADSDAMGRVIADEVLRLVAEVSADSHPVVPALVRAASVFVDFPSRALPSADELPLDQDNAEALVRIAEGGGPFEGEVQALRIGNALVVAMPGEIFCATGMAVKEVCCPLTGIPVGYANGYLGYFIPPDAWQKDTYETRLGPWSKVGPEAEAILLSTVAGLLSGIR